jgi:hypothetical protein
MFLSQKWMLWILAVQNFGLPSQKIPAKSAKKVIKPQVKYLLWFIKVFYCMGNAANVQFEKAL